MITMCAWDTSGSQCVAVSIDTFFPYPALLDFQTSLVAGMYEPRCLLVDGIDFGRGGYIESMSCLVLRARSQHQQWCEIKKFRLASGWWLLV